MNKKKVIKDVMARYRGKGGPGFMNNLGNIGRSAVQGVNSFLINNPIGKVSSAATGALIDKYNQNKANNAFLNDAAKRGFNVPNSFMKNRNKGQ